MISPLSTLPALCAVLITGQQSRERARCEKHCGEVEDIEWKRQGKTVGKPLPVNIPLHSREIAAGASFIETQQFFMRDANKHVQMPAIPTFYFDLAINKNTLKKKFLACLATKFMIDHEHHPTTERRGNQTKTKKTSVRKKRTLVN